MADTKQFNYADKAMQKDTMLGPESSQTAVAATKFGGEVLQTRPACCDNSSSSYESVSDTSSQHIQSKNRRRLIVARAEQREGNVDRSVNEAVAAMKAIEATAVESRRTSAAAATSKAIAARRKLPPSEDRSRKNSRSYCVEE